MIEDRSKRAFSTCITAVACGSSWVAAVVRPSAGVCDGVDVVAMDSDTGFQTGGSVER